MPMTAFLAPPRLAAALITALLILTCVLVGTANAAPTDFCSPGVTTTFKGGSSWDDGDNWTDGQPKPGKSATVTLKLNGTGTKLLKQTHKLKVHLTIKSGGKVITKKAVTLTA
jgi:hypothetical protein